MPEQQEKIKYFFGNYETVSDENGSKEFLFINSPTGLCAIIEGYTLNGTRKRKTWRTYSDHLGSIIYAENIDSTSEKRKYSYDPWGNVRKASDWLDPEPGFDLLADRGYTGHEHLNNGSLINMNGRVYDPVVGRFLSVDPLVQNTFANDGFNRYAYCWNNPLKYVDPSGYGINPYERYGGWYNYIDMLQKGICPYQYVEDGGPHGGGGGGGETDTVTQTNYKYVRSIYRNNGLLRPNGREGLTRVPDGTEDRIIFIPSFDYGYDFGYSPESFPGEELDPSSVDITNSPSQNLSHSGGGSGPQGGGGVPQLYGTNRAERQPDGELNTFSAGFAFVGGMSMEFGTVTDNQGGKIRIKIINSNIGFGLGAGFSSKAIYVTPNDPDGVFTVDDFLNSYTHEVEGGFAIFDVSKGWQASDNYTERSNPYFIIQGGGSSIGLKFHLWWTRSTQTSQW